MKNEKTSLDISGNPNPELCKQPGFDIPLRFAVVQSIDIQQS
jgi:hypothetical protein